jgi:broad specificity phosphatase PhoE
VRELMPNPARGRAQAESLRAWIDSRRIDRVVTSDLVRARETAALLGFPDAEADARWREVDVGAWTGRPATELVEEEPAAYDACGPAGSRRRVGSPSPSSPPASRRPGAG